MLRSILKNSICELWTKPIKPLLTHPPNYVFASSFSLILPHPGEAWRCYFCTSDKSWDHCEKNRFFDSCKNSLNRCTKFFWEYEDKNGTIIQKYEKGCGYHYECDACSKHECALDKSRKCEVNCCLADLCNAGSNLILNVFLFWTCLSAGFTWFALAR